MYLVKPMHVENPKQSKKTTVIKKVIVLPFVRDTHPIRFGALTLLVVGGILKHLPEHLYTLFKPLDPVQIGTIIPTPKELQNLKG